MPENRTRHTCYVCKKKRYARYMQRVGYYGQGDVWVCDLPRYKSNIWEDSCISQYKRPPYVLPLESVVINSDI